MEPASSSEDCFPDFSLSELGARDLSEDIVCLCISWKIEKEGLGGCRSLSRIKAVKRIGI
jgi:hypothetical protein